MHQSLRKRRAAMAVLRQQMVFIERMAHSGMVTQQESQMMSEPVDTARRKLAHRGPVWRAPLVIDVLRSMPIMRDVSDHAVSQSARLRADSRLSNLQRLTLAMLSYIWCMHTCKHGVLRGTHHCELQTLSFEHVEYYTSSSVPTVQTPHFRKRMPRGCCDVLLPLCFALAGNLVTSSC